VTMSPTPASHTRSFDGHDFEDPSREALKQSLNREIALNIHEQALCGRLVRYVVVAKDVMHCLVKG
jgi:hypothetical protein